MSGTKRRQRCLSCMPSEWAAIKRRARDAGMDISPLIRSRLLDGQPPDGPPHPDAGYPMALNGAEQRRQLELLERLEADNRLLLDAPFMPGTGATLRQALTFVMQSSSLPVAGAGPAAADPASGGGRSSRDGAPAGPDFHAEVAALLNRKARS